MLEPTNQEIKAIILRQDHKIQELKELVLNQDKKFQELRELILGLGKKIDVQFIELKSNIKSVEDRLGGEFKRVEEKVSGIDKRISNEEFISRGALTAVFVSVAAGIIKYLFSAPVPTF